MPSRPPQTHRRQILKGAAALGLAAALPRWSRLSAADAPAVVTDSKTKTNTKYNVLFIMSDDMRPELDFYGNPLVQSPNLAALAKSGVMFERGYCPFPLCCPSRSATLNGRHVIHTGVYSNRTWFGDIHPEFVSLPKYFMHNGYITMHSGKIFHGGIDDTEAWTEGGQVRSLAGAADPNAEMDIPLPPPGRTGVFGQAARGAAAAASPQTRPGGSDSIVVLQGNGENHGDYHAATQAVNYLRDYKGKYGDQPFFMGFGTVKPHSPPTAPQKWFDAIDVNKIQLPADFAPSRKLPEGFPEGCLRPRNADLFIGRDASVEEA
ncbi:MAG TPA: sulfatase-like hydrolase/transferase, partial [Opitutales bacterium]|nr:sulfatase-like hydrolase/transferase [Opitutales bacterium]